MPLLQMLDDTEQPGVIVGRKLTVVFLRGENISTRIRFSRRRVFHCSDLDAMLCKIRPEIFPVAVILVFEQQNRVDNVASEKQ
jgi:hypothetical protein